MHFPPGWCVMSAPQAVISQPVGLQFPNVQISCLLNELLALPALGASEDGPVREMSGLRQE